MKRQMFLSVLVLGAWCSVALAGEKTWNPTTLDGTVYKWSCAANWLDGGSPAASAPGTGESVVFDSTAAAITAYNDIADIQLSKVTFRGTHDITLSGGKMVAINQGGFFAENAPITVTLALPIDLGGTVYFSSTSNGVAKGATYELTGAIGEFPGVAGVLATGGDFSGIYNFRGNNTYTGETYLTNGLAYNVYSDTAFGSAKGKTNYLINENPLFADIDNFDKYLSTIYWHGVTTDEPLNVKGYQLRDMVFVSNTTNILRGEVVSPNQVERWTIGKNALAVLTNKVSFADTCQLNVGKNGTLVFSNKVSITSQLLRCAVDSTGQIIFMDEIDLRDSTKSKVNSEFVIYGSGETILGKDNCMGVAPGVISSTHNGTLTLKGTRQQALSLYDKGGITITSTEGTALELLNVTHAYSRTKFNGNVSLRVAGGVLKLTEHTSATTGEMVATNGGAVVLTSITDTGLKRTFASSTWPNVKAVRVYAGSSVTVTTNNSINANVMLDLHDTGKLILSNGYTQTVGTLLLNGQEAVYGKTYGATGSGADIIDDVHFAGTGRVSYTGTRAYTLTWVGPASGGNFNTAANWSPAVTPHAGDTLIVAGKAGATFNNDCADLTLYGLTLRGTDAGDAITVKGNTIGLGLGAKALFTNGTFTVSCGFALADLKNVTIAAATSTILNLNGVISGIAPLTLEGLGSLYLAGANTFTNKLTAHVQNLHLTHNQAMGTTDGETTFLRLAGENWYRVYFHDVTTSERITTNSGVSDDHISFFGRNVFNGAWTKGNEQIRAYVRDNSSARFNADFAGDIQYMTINVSKSGTLDFNAAMSGYPRFQGEGTIIFRKGLRYTSRYNNSYHFLYSQSAGVRQYLMPYIFGTGTQTPVIDGSGNSNVVLDFCGNDQEVAAIEGAKFGLTSSTGPATIYVRNDVVSTSSGVFNGYFAGELSVAFSGGSATKSVTLKGTSTSLGTLYATNGCTVTLVSGASWKGNINVAKDSAVVLNDGASLDDSSFVSIQEGGSLTLGGGTLQVAELLLNGVACKEGETYGASGSGAQNESAYLKGTGLIKVIHPITGIMRTWVGAAGGTWNTASNWNPAGVPEENDVLVFNATADIASINDMPTTPVLKGFKFTGNGAVALSGTGVTIVDEGSITAPNSAATITLGLPITLAAGAQTISATSNTTGAVTWELTGGFAGTGTLTFAGDRSATVHFRADSSSYTGNLDLRNARAYHIWTDGAFGSPEGYTFYGTTQGDAHVNIGLTLEPMYFHGITTAEPFILYANGTYGWYFANNTTNTFTGSIDAYATDDVERMWVGTNACLRFNGVVGGKTIAGTQVLNHLIPSAQPGASVEINGSVAAAGVRAHGSAEVTQLGLPAGAYYLNAKLGANTGYFGNYGNWAPVYFGCENALEIAQGTYATFNFGGPNVLDLNGYDQTIVTWTTANGADVNMKVTTFTSTRAGATLHLQSPVSATWLCSFTGDLALALESAQTYTLTASNNATGALTIGSGATATFADEALWLGTNVTVAASGRLHLPKEALNTAASIVVAAGGKVKVNADVNQCVSRLVLDGVEQTVFKTYGSTASTADVKNDAYFEGEGVICVIPDVVGITRTWVGGASTDLGTANNWSPAGVPTCGDTLVFEPTADCTLNNTCAGLVVRGLVFQGGHTITLTGNALNLIDTGTGISVAEDTAVHVTCPIVTWRIKQDAQVTFSAAANAILSLEGIISGDAALAITGDGSVALKGANTFTGVLTVSAKKFEAWGPSPLGSAAGKTTFNVPSSAEKDVTYSFHGVTIDDDVEWGQSNGNTCGYFAPNTVNTFNGVFTGILAQPRWEIQTGAIVHMTNAVVNVGSFTVTSSENSYFYLHEGMQGNQLRFQGAGTCYILKPMILSGTDYAIAFGADTRKCIHFLAENVLDVSASEQNKTGASTLGLEGGTIDLHGYNQKACILIGTAYGVLTNSGACATIHVLQTIRGCINPNTTTVYNGTYGGVVTGPINLSIEGNPKPVGPYWNNTTAALIPTQTLTGVSTSSGALIATNNAIVAFREGGRWAGTNVIVHANAKVILSAAQSLARDADVYLENDDTTTSGKLVLEEGVIQRCHYLYVNGVRQARGLYGSGEAGSPAAVQYVRGDLFEGKGAFRAVGDKGIVITFR